MTPVTALWAAFFAGGFVALGVTATFAAAWPVAAVNYVSAAALLGALAAHRKGWLS